MIGSRTRRGRCVLADAFRSATRRVARHARDIVSAENAIAGIEFALLLPVLITLMLGGTQLVTYINATRKVDLVARSISQMISQVVPPDGSTVATVNATDIHFSYDSALVLFPYILADGARQNVAWWQNLSINYAAIQFTKVSSSCTDVTDQSACYLANVVWTSGGAGQPSSGPNYRPCILPQLPAANTAAATRSTLPRSVYGPASIIVIDVVYTFKPTLGSGLMPTMRIARSTYVQPRYASLVSYDMTNTDGMAFKCPGY